MWCLSFFSGLLNFVFSTFVHVVTGEGCVFSFFFNERIALHHVCVLNFLSLHLLKELKLLT